MANFEYYYGSDAEQFNFFRLPKKLIQDKRFDISGEAKILYGVLLDRMTLSLKNGWVDRDNRVYIIYTIKEVAEEFNCSERKAYMLMNELDTAKGIGLIERKRQGLGKPNIIYVKNFNSIDVSNKNELEPQNNTYQITENKAEAEMDEQFQDEWMQTGIVQPVQTCKTMQVKTCKDVQVKTCKNVQVKTCKDVQVKTCKNVQVKNDTENNKTKYNNNLSINPSNELEFVTVAVEDGWKDRDLVMNILRKKLSYDSLLQDYPYCQDRIRELFCLMADVCCYSGDTVPVGGNLVSIHDLRVRFMQQFSVEHIRYVLEALEQNTKKVTNIRAYLLTCLYNAPVTMHSFYHAAVQHDQYG